MKLDPRTTVDVSKIDHINTKFLSVQFKLADSCADLVLHCNLDNGTLTFHTQGKYQIHINDLLAVADNMTDSSFIEIKDLIKAKIWERSFIEDMQTETLTSGLEYDVAENVEQGLKVYYGK